MQSFKSQADFLECLRTEIRNRHRVPAGAAFTVALIAVEGNGLMFATGKIVFCDEVVPARGAFLYPAMVLAEEWIAGPEPALERLALLLEGAASVAGQQVRGRFGGTYSERAVHSFWPRLTPWAELTFKTAWHHEGPRPTVNNEPVVAFGLPPYQSTRSAVSEWVYDRVLASGSDAPHMNELLTILPDTRARISDAKWEHDHVIVSVAANCDRQDLELHAVFLDTYQRQYESVRAPETQVRLKVPDDAGGVWLSLIHSSGARLGETILNQAYRTMQDQPEVSPLADQVRRDLTGGENEQVEFKPFIEPGDLKQREVVETVIAFANTQGGRILFGVDDHRNLLGRGKMTGALPPDKSGRDPEKRFRDWASKLINDKCKPVPQFSVHLLEIHGEPVGVVDVRRGKQHERPYQTHENTVLVRKGSNNVVPDMKTEWSAFFGAVPLPSGILGTGLF